MSSELVKAINYLDRDLGDRTPEQDEQLKEVLRDFMVRLQELRQVSTRRFYTAFPNEPQPCATCAFNPRTNDWQGCVPTAYNVLTAVRGETMFGCHANQPEWQKGRVDLSTLEMCTGFFATMVESEDEARTLADETTEAIRKIVGAPDTG